MNLLRRNHMWVRYSSFFCTPVITASLPQKRGLATGLLELKVVSCYVRNKAKVKVELAVAKLIQQ